MWSYVCILWYTLPLVDWKPQDTRAPVGLVSCRRLAMRSERAMPWKCSCPVTWSPSQQPTFTAPPDLRQKSSHGTMLLFKYLLGFHIHCLRGLYNMWWWVDTSFPKTWFGIKTVWFPNIHCLHPLHWSHQTLVLFLSGLTLRRMPSLLCLVTSV